MSDFPGDAYDRWLTSAYDDRESQVPVEDQPGYDPDAENDRDRDDDYDTGMEF